MQMVDDLLEDTYGACMIKGSHPASPVGNTIFRENAVPPTTLHHWSQILADMKTTQARLGGKAMGLQGTSFEARVF
ncbi:hypothetical protein N7471_002870 [Penicillium samsonianum]|uniref:uncharacterized protein n=1 Tax=Penicillium samsonianum TaxID=1882272 RepID=UPI002546D5D3|nr:uncharacterized protein N7471_002870 [Penicillium samsonianum]KAJ6143417.1 hypothetical protein N7471_002870 [Penicillium samsonianum]